VQRVLIKLPSSRVGSLVPQERQVLLTTDEVGALMRGR
jgi:hypothetical protein